MKYPQGKILLKCKLLILALIVVFLYLLYVDLLRTSSSVTGENTASNIKQRTILSNKKEKRTRTSDKKEGFLSSIRIGNTMSSLKEKSSLSSINEQSRSISIKEESALPNTKVGSTPSSLKVQAKIDKGQCTRKDHVVYIKSHKTGSTTIASMLWR